MIKNMFRANSHVDSVSITTTSGLFESCSETDLIDFMCVYECIMTEASINNKRYIHMGEREGSYEIVQESVRDFTDKIVEFFKQFLIKIKEWFGKIFLIIQSLLGQTRDIIKNNKSALLSKQASFDISGYKYTIDSKIPDLSPLTKLISEYNKDVADIPKMKMHDIIDKRREFMDSVPKLRGTIIGTNDIIDDGELRTTIDKHLRDGDDSPITITVDNTFIQKIVSSYAELEKTLGECVKQKRILELQLEGLKRYFESGARSVVYSDGEKKVVRNRLELKDTGVSKDSIDDDVYASGSSLKIMNAYFDYRFIQSKEISNIVTTAIESKARALKDELKMYDKCIRKWILVPKDTNKGKDDK